MCPGGLAHYQKSQHHKALFVITETIAEIVCGLEVDRSPAESVHWNFQLASLFTYMVQLRLVLDADRLDQQYKDVALIMPGINPILYFETVKKQRWSIFLYQVTMVILCMQIF